MLGSTNITITVAFLAGLASFLSPCVLPLVPGYISLISGVSIDRLKQQTEERSSTRRWVIVNSLAFNVGLSLIFVSLGAASGFIGSAVFSSPWLRIIGGFVRIPSGIPKIRVAKPKTLSQDTRSFSDEKPRGLPGSLPLALALGAGWTPCIGPILGGIIGLAATSGGWKSGLVLSSFYAAGLALPFLLTGLGINQFLSFYARFRRHLHKVEVVSGVMLILIGSAIVSGYATRLASSRLASLLPNLESRIKVKTDPAADSADETEPGLLGPAPQVELSSLDDRRLKLSSFRGRF